MLATQRAHLSRGISGSRTTLTRTRTSFHLSTIDRDAKLDHAIGRLSASLGTQHQFGSTAAAVRYLQATEYSN